MRIILSMLILISIFTHISWARPVSYPGGVTAIMTNNADEHSLLIHYSPSSNYSVGVRTEYRRAGEYSLTSLQLNNLIKRWNKRKSQANVYIKSGLGYADRNSSSFADDSSLAIFSGLAMDWETRRYFASYENRYIEAGSVDDRFVQKARLGIAPYIADYGDVHTWFMLEVEHEPEDQDQFTVTPVLRIFKSVHLVELGISDKEDVMFNWIIRF